MARNVDEQRVAVTVGGEPEVTAVLGTRLIDICEDEGLPVPFSCRGGSCGTCLIRVLRGGDRLSPRSDIEEIVIADFVEPTPEYRLACQVGPVVDSVHFEVVDA